ncbi:AraC family transcriptional regulator [Microvirga lenta]|uniref:AraC family transcriptional regulator n=1 Tax=Microvirga lenta TaxID=2881337 RepID=UPI001CFE4C5F|nr:AraC family transcriptional regulator [Microvirga lenta]MCB5173889.1 AraC family transcriptional regulator [Microvirga lenta]
MPRGRNDQLPRDAPVRSPTTTGVLSKLAADRAALVGLDVGHLFRKAGISAVTATGSESRINVRNQIEFLNVTAEALQDKLLGFHLARESDLRELGALYYVMASAAKLGETVDYAVRYSFVINDAIQIHKAANSLSMEFEHVGVERHIDTHQIEFWATSLLRMARIFTGRELVPVSAEFLHQSKGDVSELERYYGCGVNFGSQRDRIVFDPQDAELRNATADPFLNKFLVEYYEGILDRRQLKQNPLRIRVENAITPRLPHGAAVVGNIASDLGMSARTLSRRLAEEGLTFSGILDDIRSNLAIRYLQNNDLSISQIAWLLGYTEVSSFVHAFQRWTGKSPTHLRRQIVQGDGTEENHKVDSQ